MVFTVLSCELTVRRTLSFLSNYTVNCGTINDTKTLTSDLLSDYNINVRPIANQSLAVNVSIEAYIKSIQEFDEVQESGERVSYCITVLLAIAVFMTIVSDMLPRSSEPVPVISIKLMIDMIISSFIVTTAILNLNLYHKDESIPIPQWLKSLYIMLSCVSCSKKKIDPHFHEMKQISSKTSTKVKTINVVENKNEPIESKIGRLVEEHDEDNKITWKKLSIMMDKVALISYTAVSVASFVIFLAITAVSSSED
ncbi:acetylcholine receptor subunit alpha-type unc-63-like [Ruditapes philippinarum]|uniref:acetylcholine receptor subunit alpha-type unc-63-like n=1 Tax=Ruditapes philippinarum TaxID=129788 RepID=UPI00295B9775|nr:acetylcholine receptor subunit alpha-type unc-63-like [Ruditapes philippinarum]